MRSERANAQISTDIMGDLRYVQECLAITTLAEAAPDCSDILNGMLIKLAPQSYVLIVNPLIRLRNV